MVSANDIGLFGPPYRFPIEEGKVKEFSSIDRSNRFCLPRWRDALALPTFLGIAGRFWGYTLDDPKDSALAAIDLDRSLLLHAEEEYEYPNGLPRAGTVLTAQTRIKDVTEKTGKRGGKLTFVVTETEFKDQAGVIVAVSRQTIVKTETAPV